MLFLQLAVAAYACAATLSGDSAASTATALSHCDTSKQPPSKRCEQHCLQDTQSVGSQPTGATGVPLLALIAVVDCPDAHVSAKRHLQIARLASAVDPPPLVRFGVLRI